MTDEWYFVRKTASGKVSMFKLVGQMRMTAQYAPGARLEDSPQEMRINVDARIVAAQTRDGSAPWEKPKEIEQ